jgi:hypothetical protein
MAINSYPDNSGGEVNFPEQLIDPVSKFRVSNPENLIDTDFEYGLQPTKWETVELINNTPSFFSKGGDTTIDGISAIITNAGTREIIVKTELDHNLAVGIPINVTGTKSITADGAYIINSIPDTKTFTYLCKDNQTDTNSILDLYSSIITGEFFQGSQLRISDSDGIVTNAEGTSTLTVTTNTTHGFGENTPFYFLNLNSSVAQEFQAANTASKSFDASNSATAQSFDGSNTLSSVNIDWSNSAIFGGTPSTISATNQAADTISVVHQAGENFNNLPLGTALYYSVSATGGYFNTNPRGIVFLKTTNTLGASTSTFQVSLVPNGDVIDLTSNLSGTFQIANQARTFAGNNINPLTQTVINIEVGTAYSFDGGNQGYAGAVQAIPPNNTLTVLSYTGTSINADGAAIADYYVGAMVRYTTTGSAPTGLVTNTTYFVTSFTNNSGGNYTFSVAALPGGTPISISGGSGTQTFSRIGISLDKDIVHIKDSNFAVEDMLEYSFPVDGRFGVATEEEEKRFYFVVTAYDAHNYKISEDLGFRPIEATGGTILPDIVSRGRTWKTHQFTSVGTTNFVVSNAGKEGLVEYLIIGGGGGSGGNFGSGGGAGGYRTNVPGQASGARSAPSGTLSVVAQTYPVVVGAGGPYAANNAVGGDGLASSFAGISATGGGGGGGNANSNGRPGGSGGGATDTAGVLRSGGAGTANQGFKGADAQNPRNLGAGGGGAGSEGGADSFGSTVFDWHRGGEGLVSDITGTPIIRAGGGGGYYGAGGSGGGGSGVLHRNAAPVANTGSGAAGDGAGGGVGASGIVIIRYPITAPVETIEAPVATGGVTSEHTSGGIRYKVHTFATVGTTNFVLSSPGNVGDFEYLIVAGGGPGGVGNSNEGGGGGGAGGVMLGKLNTLSSGTYPVIVGAGGTGGAGQSQNATNFANGQNSSAFGLVALGGGAGGNCVAVSGSAGGSGGGGGGCGGAKPGGASTQTGGFGNAGGRGQWIVATSDPNAGDNGNGGGGGGAGIAGESGFLRGNFTTAPGSVGGRGAGIRSSISGSSVVYATGGNGGAGRSNQTGANGPANTGNGGGGSSSDAQSGNGGSGIVIIRYPIGVA